jgi:hypothetical protein
MLAHQAAKLDGSNSRLRGTRRESESGVCLWILVDFLNTSPQTISVGIINTAQSRFLPKSYPLHIHHLISFHSTVYRKNETAPLHDATKLQWLDRLEWDGKMVRNDGTQSDMKGDGFGPMLSTFLDFSWLNYGNPRNHHSRQILNSSGNEPGVWRIKHWQIVSSAVAFYNM